MKIQNFKTFKKQRAPKYFLMYFLVLNLAIFMRRRKSLFWARRGVCDEFFYSCRQTCNSKLNYLARIKQRLLQYLSHGLFLFLIRTKKTTGARFRRRIHNSEEKRKSRHALSSADYKVNKSARQECNYRAVSVLLHQVTCRLIKR